MDVAIFVLYLLLLAGMGWYTKKSSGDDQFLLAGGKTGLFAMTATLVMAELNTSTLIGFSSMGYVAGNRALLLPLAFLLGLLFYAWVAAAPWKKQGGLSVIGFFHKRYGATIGRVTAVFLLLAMFGFAATYIKSLGFVFQPIIPDWPPYLTSLVIAMAVLLLCIRSGLVSVIRVDVVSFLFVLVLLPLIWYYASTGTVAEVEPQYEYEKLPVSYAFSIVLLTMFTYIASPWYGQRILSAKSPKVAYRAVAIAAVLVFGLYGLMVGAASFLPSHSKLNISPEKSIPYIIQYQLPAGWRGLTYGVLFAIGATTLSGLWTAMVAMIKSEWRTYHQKKPLDSRLLLIAIALGSYLLAEFLVDSVLRKLILANIPIYALSFAILGGFHWSRASTGGAALSIGVGFLWGTFCYLYFGESGFYTLYWAFGGLPLIFISGVMGSFIWPRPPQQNEFRISENENN